jgi:phospholipid/cholesterol/gamma-HCH transport system substrate-binding protein
MNGARRLEGGFSALVFVAISGTLLLLLGVALGDFRFQPTRSYDAVLSDSSGLKSGDEVRAAGVSVGKVTGVELRPDATVLATFTTAADVLVTSDVIATVRYKNLTGDMFLDLTRGSGRGATLPPGGAIPLSQTRPALDLDDLFNGFKPLLRGVDPDQVNQLTGSILAVFDGQTQSVQSLLSEVASFTGTLADQDAVIGQVIDNLNVVLGTLDERRDQVGSLVVNLRKVVHGLAADRHTLGGSLVRLQRLAGTGTRFLQAVRPELRGTVAQTGRVARTLNTEVAFVDRMLTLVPSALNAVGRVAAYGSFYNIYLCGVSLSYSGDKGQTIQGPVVYDTTERCRFQPGEKP